MDLWGYGLTAYGLRRPTSRLRTVGLSAQVFSICHIASKSCIRICSRQSLLVNGLGSKLSRLIVDGWASVQWMLFCSSTSITYYQTFVFFSVSPVV